MIEDFINEHSVCKTITIENFDELLVETKYKYDNNIDEIDLIPTIVEFIYDIKHKGLKDIKSFTMSYEQKNEFSTELSMYEVRRLYSLYSDVSIYLGNIDIVGKILIIVFKDNSYLRFKVIESVK